MFDIRFSGRVGTGCRIGKNAYSSAHVNIVRIVAGLFVAVRLAGYVNIFCFCAAKQNLVRKFSRPQCAYKSSDACRIGSIGRLEIYYRIFTGIAGYRNVCENTVRHQSERTADKAFAFKVGVTVGNIFCVLHSVNKMRRAFACRANRLCIIYAYVLYRSIAENISYRAAHANVVSKIAL